jgi:hypothetical protein
MAPGAVPVPGGDKLLAMRDARVAGSPLAPARINPRRSARVEEIIPPARERDPGKRCGPAAEMIQDLEHPDQGTSAGRAGRPRTPDRGRLIGLRVRDSALAFFAIMGFFALAILFMLTIGRHR